MDFKIPKKLILGGNNITIEIVSSCKDCGNTAYGLALFKENKIQIVKADNKDFMNNIFFHELTHFILNLIGEDDLSNNEKLVTQIGLLIHQAIKTME